MRVEDLVKQCVAAINDPNRPADREAVIILTGRKTLFPRGGGPRPIELACKKPNGERTWFYSASKVLAALAAHGLVNVEFEAREDSNGD